jgi:5-formyltetrahydrofolate cyclo-ligase
MMDIDPDQRAALARKAKRQLRQRLRAVRAATPAKALAARSAAIVRHLVEQPDYVRARSVALFWPIESNKEVDLRAVDGHARAAGKSVYYPRIDRGGEEAQAAFARVASPTELESRGSQFAEPPAEAPPARAGDIDLLVVPALGVCSSGYRIGYGSAFYDEALARFCPPARSIIVVFDFQLLAEVPTEPHDLPGDIVITDRRVIDTAGARA